MHANPTQPPSPTPSTFTPEASSTLDRANLSASSGSVFVLEDEDVPRRALSFSSTDSAPPKDNVTTNDVSLQVSVDTSETALKPVAQGVLIVRTPADAVSSPPHNPGVLPNEDTDSSAGVQPVRTPSTPPRASGSVALPYAPRRKSKLSASSRRIVSCVREARRLGSTLGSHWTTGGPPGPPAKTAKEIEMTFIKEQSQFVPSGDESSD